MRRPLWIIIVSAGVCVGLTLGFRQALGLFLTPISLDTGMGREMFALSLGLANLFWGLTAPFAGAIADRAGAGRVAAAGGLCYAAGLAAFTLSGDGEQLILGGILIGCGLSGAGFSVVLGAVGRVAPEEKRGAALGAVAMGGSIGQFVALPYTFAFLEGYGWTFSLFALAMTTLLIVPIAWGISGKPVAETSAERQTIVQALGEASRSPSFWLLNFGFFACGFHLAFITVHFPAYLADQGFAPWLATASLTALGICNIIGSYGCGVLGDRFPKKYVLSFMYIGRAVIFAGFLLLPISEATVIVFGALMGFLWIGTVPLTSALVATMFGTGYLSMLFGLVFFGHQVGSFLGAWLAGHFYDLIGSYDPVWWLCVAIGLLSAALHWPISERPVERLAHSEMLQ